MRYLVLTVALLAVIAGAQEKTQVKIETPSGTVEWKESDGKTMAQIVRDLTPQELRDLRLDADASVAFVTRYAPNERKAEHPLDALDLAFAGWMASVDPAKESPDRVVQMLGAAYGFYCIEHLGMRWAWTTDQWGDEIALVRDDPTAQGYPFSSIRYRIADKKTDFIYALYASLEHLIHEVQGKKEPNQPPQTTPVSAPR